MAGGNGVSGFQEPNSYSNSEVLEARAFVQKSSNSEISTTIYQHNIPRRYSFSKTIIKKDIEDAEGKETIENIGDIFFPAKLLRFYKNFYPPGKI